MTHRTVLRNVHSGQSRRGNHGYRSNTRQGLAVGRSNKSRKPHKNAPKPAPPPTLNELLVELARREATYRAGPRHHERNATDLIAALRAIGARGTTAEPTLPVLAEYVNHPGEYRVPEEVVYWDWTMSDDCKEVRPGYAVTVAETAVAAMGAIGPAALPELEAVCAGAPPSLRLAALCELCRPSMRALARRSEELARVELSRPDCSNREATARIVCRCRMLAEPTASGAVALIGDPEDAVALGALEFTYNSWPDILTAEQVRGAGWDFRQALARRFGDPSARIIANAVAALMNPLIASRDVEVAVRHLADHPNADVRRQVNNVLITLDRLALPPAPLPGVASSP